MMLDKDIVDNAKKSKKQIYYLLNSKFKLYINYLVVSDYKIPIFVRGDNCNESDMNEIIKNFTVVEFFDKYTHIMTISKNICLDNVDNKYIIDKFKNNLKFLYEFNLHIFGTFIAVEINPKTDKVEYLVLSPKREDKKTKGESGKYIAGICDSLAINDITVNMQFNYEEQMLFYLGVDNLLHYLRTGNGRKKFLGFL